MKIKNHTWNQQLNAAYVEEQRKYDLRLGILKNLKKEKS